MQPEKPKDPYAGIVVRGSPCAWEAEDWRDCLKQDDYMPDRDMKKCDKKRKTFYDCTKAWRAKQPQPTQMQPTGNSSSAANKSAPTKTLIGSTLPELCSGLADKLRVCMEMSMFETGKCQREMTWLRECVGRIDPEVGGIVAELAAEEANSKSREDEALQIPQLSHMEQKSWHELWNTKPKHAQDKK